MLNYNKILIIGNCGAGKSTLSVKLSSLLGLPVIHLDKHFWRPGWQPTPVNEWMDAVKKIIEQERWIIDGNYYNTIDIRMARADLIIFLDVSPLICLYRVLGRTIMRKDRSDMPNGYSDRFDLSFYRYILGYNRKMKPVILELLKQRPPHCELIITKNINNIEKILSHKIETNC